MSVCASIHVLYLALERDLVSHILEAGGVATFRRRDGRCSMHCLLFLLRSCLSMLRYLQFLVSSKQLSVETRDSRLSSSARNESVMIVKKKVYTLNKHCITPFRVYRLATTVKYACRFTAVPAPGASREAGDAPSPVRVSPSRRHGYATLRANCPISPQKRRAILRERSLRFIRVRRGKLLHLRYGFSV